MLTILTLSRLGSFLQRVFAQARNHLIQISPLRPIAKDDIVELTADTTFGNKGIAGKKGTARTYPKGTRGTVLQVERVIGKASGKPHTFALIEVEGQPGGNTDAIRPHTDFLRRAGRVEKPTDS